MTRISPSANAPELGMQVRVSAPILSTRSQRRVSIVSRFHTHEHAIVTSVFRLLRFHITKYINIGLGIKHSNSTFHLSIYNDELCTIVLSSYGCINVGSLSLHNYVFVDNPSCYVASSYENICLRGWFR